MSRCTERGEDGMTVQVGDRVRIIRWATDGASIDDNETVPAGTEGTVSMLIPEFSFMAEQITVEWDNGAKLGLLEEDEWEPVEGRADKPQGVHGGGS